jgi:hypothetical protein
LADYKEEVPERYKISFNRMQGAFYIMDMWHDSVRNLPVDADVPDNSPAMKVITSLEVNALLGELKKMGWLDKLFGAADKPAGAVYASTKTIHEISIENITAIIQADKDSGVAKEAISAIRDIMNKI